MIPKKNKELSLSPAKYNSMKRKFLSRKVKPVEVTPKSLDGLLKAMGETGFQGKTLAETLNVWEAMARDPNTTILLGYAGSMSTTGQWKIIKWLVKNRYVDAIVSTGANISEDVVEAMGYHYYQGSPVADDAALLKCDIDRYYDVYVDDLQYAKMMDFISDFLETLDPKYSYSSAEFLHEFGKYQAKHGVDSITTEAYRQNVPVFSPAMVDSAYGESATWLRWKKGKEVNVNQFKDFYQLADIGKKAKGTSVVYIGGGVPKDTIQLITVMQEFFAGYPEFREIAPHDYAIQITTDSPQWGGLSGCTFEEAISWGKISTKAKRAVCYCDATIALPILSHGLLERLGGKPRKGGDLSWVFDGLPNK